MTQEQLWIILRHALVHLIATCSPRALRAKEPWLDLAQVQWCLDHLHECRWETDADREARAFLHQAAQALHVQSKEN